MVNDNLQLKLIKSGKLLIFSKLLSQLSLQYSLERINIQNEI